MNNKSITYVPSMGNREISEQGIQAFSDYLASDAKNIMQYSRIHVVPIMSSTDPTVVAKWVLPHDPETVTKITKEYKFGDQTLVLEYNKFSYYENVGTGANARVNKVEEIMLNYDDVTNIQIYASMHALRADLISTENAVRILAEPFVGVDIVDDKTGESLVGANFAASYYGLTKTDSARGQQIINSASTVRNISHATNVMGAQKDARLWAVLYQLASTGEINNFKTGTSTGLEKLGKDKFSIPVLDNSTTVEDSLITVSYRPVNKALFGNNGPATTEGNILMKTDLTTESFMNGASAPMNDKVQAPAGKDKKFTTGK